jgi:LacI family transcriptional regulator
MHLHNIKGEKVLMKCTINDIARELNFSRNTVSKALNGSPGVSTETQKIVLQKAREMNYKKFLLETTAPIETSTRRGTILFLTLASVMCLEFCVGVMRGIEDVLYTNGYTLALGVMSTEDFKDLHFPTILKDEMIKGIIVAEIYNLRVYEALINFKLPLVTVDMPIQYESLLGRMDIITIENKTNIKKVVNLLCEKGRRRFAFAGDLYSNNVGYGFHERYNAMCEVLEGRGLTIDKNCCLICEQNEYFMNFNRLKKRLEEIPSLPEVFICGNDWTALHMIYTLQALGYKIPKNVEIVGFDNIPDAEKHIPSLTTVHTPRDLLGIAAANTLISRIQNPSTPHVFSQYSTDLILRDSTSL